MAQGENVPAALDRDSSRAALVNRAYLDTVLQHGHLPGAVYLCGFREVEAVLSDVRFCRPLPRINASAASMAILSKWTVFRNDPAHRRLRRLLIACLKGSVSGNLLQSLDDKIQRVVVSNVGKGSVDACRSLSDPLTHMVVSDICGIPLDRVVALHAASELIDMSAEPSICVPEVDRAVSLFCGAASESSLFELAMRVARNTDASLDRETIKQNLGMLLYGFFGPLPAALSNVVLAMSLNDGWNDIDACVAEAWLHESLRLFSPTAAIDRVASDSFESGGTILRRGQMIRCVVAAANRDGSIFPNPSTFDAQRSNAATHLGFGRGRHSCIGTSLVEFIGSSLIRNIALHAHRIRLLSTSIEWRTFVNAMGPRELLVRIVSRAEPGY